MKQKDARATRSPPVFRNGGFNDALPLDDTAREAVGLAHDIGRSLGLPVANSFALAAALASLGDFMPSLPKMDEKLTTPEAASPDDFPGAPWHLALIGRRQTLFVESVFRRGFLIARAEGRPRAACADLMLSLLHHEECGVVRWLCRSQWTLGTTSVGPWSRSPRYWRKKFVYDNSHVLGVSWDEGRDGCPAPVRAPEPPPDDAPVPEDSGPEQRRNFDPDALWASLSAEFPWMEEANSILASSAAMLGKGKIDRLPPMLLVGPSGIGKTFWCLRAAAEIGYHATVVAGGGSTSGATVTGFEAGWDKSTVSLPTRALAEAGCPDPMVIIDEIDKCGDSRSGGNIPESMLPLLVSDTAKVFRDIHTNQVVDASLISWMMTANCLDALTGPFLDRVNIIHARRPTPAEVTGALVRLHETAGAEARSLDSDLASMERAYLEQGSLRAASKALEKAMRDREWCPPVTNFQGAKLRLVGA